MPFLENKPNLNWSSPPPFIKKKSEKKNFTLKIGLFSTHCTGHCIPQCRGMIHVSDRNNLKAEQEDFFAT